MFSEVLRGIGRTRGLPLPSEVELKIVTVGWVKENWGTKQVEVASKEVEEKIYKALLLIPGNVSLHEFKVQQASAILAATLENKVYIVKEYFNPR